MTLCRNSRRKDSNGVSGKGRWKVSRDFDEALPEDVLEALEGME
jgi:hypothetical protein